MSTNFESLAKNWKIENRIRYIKNKYFDKKIIIYGAGTLAEYIIDTYDLSQLNIVGISDRKFMNQGDSFKGISTIPCWKLKETDFDVILLFAVSIEGLTNFLTPLLLRKEQKSINIEAIIEKSLKETIVDVYNNKIQLGFMEALK